MIMRKASDADVVSEIFAVLATTETWEDPSAILECIAQLVELTGRPNPGSVGPFTEANVGTYLEGAQGWHNTYRVVDFAEAYGFTLDTNDARAVDAYRNGKEYFINDLGKREDVSLWVQAIADDATDWLNRFVPEGYAFTWDAGELSLSEIGEDY